MNTTTDVAQVLTRSMAPPRRVHPRSWLSEFSGTTALLFSAVTCSQWLFAPDSALARVVTGVHWRMVIVGLVVGIVLSLLIVSPLGRRSGGHLNPAITIAFSRLGAFPRRDVAGYVAAQLAGSVAGTALARLVWGSGASREPVRFGVVQPEAGLGWPAVFATEAVSVVALVALVAFLLARPRLARWTPWAVGAVVGLIIAATGASTGGSFNPARAFGPAVYSGVIGDLWCYFDRATGRCAACDHGPVDESRAGADLSTVRRPRTSGAGECGSQRGRLVRKGDQAVDVVALVEGSDDQQVQRAGKQPRLEQLHEPLTLDRQRARRPLFTRRDDDNSTFEP